PAVQRGLRGAGDHRGAARRLHRRGRHLPPRGRLRARGGQDQVAPGHNRSMALSDEQIARVIELALDLARQGETSQLLEFLDHGLPVDTQSEATGDSLLMLAAYHGHAETVAALVERGAD